MSNACTNNNGGCNQVCTTNERSDVICLCFQGHVLDADNKTCIGQVSVYNLRIPFNLSVWMSNPKFNLLE